MLRNDLACEWNYACFLCHAVLSQLAFFHLLPFPQPLTSYTSFGRLQPFSPTLCTTLLCWSSTHPIIIPCFAILSIRKCPGTPSSLNRNHICSIAFNLLLARLVSRFLPLFACLLSRRAAMIAKQIESWYVWDVVALLFSAVCLALMVAIAVHGISYAIVLSKVRRPFHSREWFWFRTQQSWWQNHLPCRMMPRYRLCCRSSFFVEGLWRVWQGWWDAIGQCVPIWS